MKAKVVRLAKIPAEVVRLAEMKAEVAYKVPKYEKICTFLVKTGLKLQILCLFEKFLALFCHFMANYP